MPRVVIDTVVFVRSLLNPRSIWGSLIFAHATDYRLIVSRPILLEFIDVLNRPKLVRLFHFLEGMDRTKVLALLSQAEVVELSNIPAVSRDPKDDKLLATAVEGRASYLVSEDRDLLDLQTYEGVQILTAAAFVRILKEEGKKAA